LEEAELAGMRAQLAQSPAENARLLRLLKLTSSQGRPPGPSTAKALAGSIPAR
jgi:hypothetical protein